MSLLDGLKDAMINPLFESATESSIDDDMDFEFALEAAVDPQIELSDADIIAILDDENPDNIVSDMTTKDEDIKKIEKDSIEEGATMEAMCDEGAALEALLDELIANEGNSEEPPEAAQPTSVEGCTRAACETDDDDDLEDNDADDEEDDDDYTTLDSLLNSIF